LTHIIANYSHESWGPQQGGIGAVLDGLHKDNTLNSRAKILYCGPVDEAEIFRLNQLHLDQEIVDIGRKYNVSIHFGIHNVGGLEKMVLLVNSDRFNQDKLNHFKHRVFEITNTNGYALHSDRFEDNWDFNEHLRNSLPLVEAIAVLAKRMSADKITLVSHEYMGTPFLLCSALPEIGLKDIARRIYWAHEYPLARNIVEEFELNKVLGRGHDTMFYNVMSQTLRSGKSVRDIPLFWEQAQNNYRYAMIHAAVPFMHNLIAVGDQTRDELVFGGTPRNLISVVPNGINYELIGADRKRNSRNVLLEYCRNLGLLRPDYICTQVARGVLSKAPWRAAGIMHELDSHLHKEGKRAVLFYLISPGYRRKPEQIAEFERYGWPIVHEDKELGDFGKDIYTFAEHFNKTHTNTQLVLINQYVSDNASLGSRAPRDLSFIDFRIGTDIEFNLAIYEPFGISPIEPLPYGAMIVVSNPNGCANFLVKASRQYGRDSPIIVADYCTLDGEIMPSDPLQIGRALREQVEARVNKSVAAELYSKLKMEGVDRLAIGQDIASNFLWKNIISNYLLQILN
jgi:hypothetical protein